MANSLKASDLRTKSRDELKEELLGLRKESFNLRFQAASGQLENTARCRQVTRGIARIKTILGELDIALEALVAKVLEQFRRVVEVRVDTGVRLGVLSLQSLLLRLRGLLARLAQSAARGRAAQREA